MTAGSPRKFPAIEYRTSEAERKREWIMLKLNTNMKNQKRKKN